MVTGNLNDKICPCCAGKRLLGREGIVCKTISDVNLLFSLTVEKNDTLLEKSPKPRHYYSNIV